jgi:hypothetical protein
VLLLLGAGVGLGVLVSRTSGANFDEAPTETRGVWTTRDARYAGRALEVTAVTVHLRLGDAGASVYGRLLVARESFEDDERVLRLEYETQDGPDQLQLVLHGDGSMHFSNQPDVVWTRVVDGAQAPPRAPGAMSSRVTR